MAREVYNPLYLSPHNFGKREGNSNNAIEVHLVPPATRAIVFSANASLPVVGRSISMYFRMYLRNVKRGEQRARFLCSGAREGERVGAGRRRGGWELALGEESTIFTVYRGIKVEICRGGRFPCVRRCCGVRETRPWRISIGFAGSMHRVAFRYVKFIFSQPPGETF